MNSQTFDPTMILQMAGIAKSFPGVRALDGVSFSVRRGEVHALVGENGAGKSTLMKILSGAYQADQGVITFDGRAVAFPTPSQMIGLGIAVIYQEFAQAPHLTVAENIFLHRLPRTRFGLIDWKQAANYAKRFMDRLGFTVDPLARVDRLSVAQRQMVEIARALSRNARLIVLDEPSAVLGDNELQKLFTTIRSLQEEGVSFIYISHRLKEVFDISQTVTVLRDGKVVNSTATSEMTTDDLIRSMVGRSIGDYFPARNPRFGADVLKISNINRGKVLKEISLNLRGGEIVGICGLAGAGRSELLRAIIGADAIDRGRIELHGKALVIDKPRKAIALGIGFAPEDRKTDGLFLSQSVSFNITISRLRDVLSGFWLNLAHERKTAQDLAARLRIKTPDVDARVGNLSGGNQQKCVIAKQLHAKCDVLLVDEPTRGVDVGAKREIYDLLVDLTEHNGLAILMVSSDLPEVIGMCDRILVMCEGRITAELAKADATEEEIMKYATVH
ncbi:sugar ABC transporter ATP-binding protein [Mesorhizobium sp. Root157]|uniref:sugar ABC transporter ATP-binding protein n=1 Tax=Mesorhizobium sp. Root157 TaxID=1736477 RepID=UPI001FCDAE6C|nr:sugar ABC transporter ATP-binding protein [Mesorhizobium sp. Root157]